MNESDGKLIAYMASIAFCLSTIVYAVTGSAVVSILSLLVMCAVGAGVNHLMAVRYSQSCDKG